MMAKTSDISSKKGNGINFLAASLCAYFLVVLSVVPYMAFRFISDYQTKLRFSEYNAVAKTMEESSLAFVRNNYESMGVLSIAVGQKCPLAVDWPHCDFKLAEYADLSNSITNITNAKTLEVAPFVNSSEVSAFEDFAFNWFDSQGRPDLGEQSFGRGVYDRFPNGSLHHVTDSSEDDGSFVVPILYAGNLHANAPIILYNIYSNAGGISAIDTLLICSSGSADRESLFNSTYARGCFSSTNTVKLIQDSVPHPSYLAYHPIVPAVESEKVVGVIAAVVNWVELFEAWGRQNTRGLTCVVRSNFSVNTFSFDSAGEAMYVGEGDLHQLDAVDPEQYRRDFLVDGIHTFSLYPNNEFGQIYSDGLPWTGAMTSLAILILTSIVVFVYAFYVDRNARENMIISNTKRLFVRYISHEIRTPMNMVNMGLTVLRHEMVKLVDCIAQTDNLADSPLGSIADSVGSLIVEIEHNADSAVQVLDDLISYDKVIMNALEMDLCLEHDICQLLQDTIRQFNLQIRSKNIKLTCCYNLPKSAISTCSLSGDIESDSFYRNNNDSVGTNKNIPITTKSPTATANRADVDAPPVTCALVTAIDSVKITQVLSSLIANALKYTPEYGIVDIKVDWSGPGRLPVDVVVEDMFHVTTSGVLSITITDSGLGISEEDLGLVFDEGFQSNAKRLPSGAGGGLGLWVSKGIVANHSGELTAASAGLNKGSKFTIYLPTYCRDEDRYPRTFKQLAPTPKSSVAGAGLYRYQTVPGNNAACDIENAGASASTSSSGTAGGALTSPVRASGSRSPGFFGGRVVDEDSLNKRTSIDASNGRVQQLGAVGRRPSSPDDRSFSISMSGMSVYTLRNTSSTDNPVIPDVINTSNAGRAVNAVSDNFPRIVVPSPVIAPTTTSSASTKVSPVATNCGSSVPVHAVVSSSPGGSTSEPACSAVVSTAEPRARATGAVRHPAVQYVLIVDDVSMNRKILARLLNNIGYTCFEVADGRECVDLVQSTLEGGVGMNTIGGSATRRVEDVHFDLILMDYNMPIMDGGLASKKLREFGVKIPIFGLTGNVLADDFKKFRACGVNDVLKKPFDVTQFNSALNALFE